MTSISRDLLLLKPDDKYEKYYSRKEAGETVINIHWGQFKLLFNEIAFLNYFYSIKDVVNPIVIYAGAAPGIHIPILVKMFPNVLKWYLYDPREFDIRTDAYTMEKIGINEYSDNGFFTDAIAYKFKELSEEYGLNIFFISDIRIREYEDSNPEGYAKNEKQIIKDNEDQMRWVQIINPVKAHLKFRMPHFGVLPEQYVEFYDGIIMKQPWAPQASTETRLIIDANAKNIWYDTKLYEEQMFYFNKVVREQIEFNLNGAKFDNVDTINDELINDFDSMMTLQILLDYLNKDKDNIDELYDESLKNIIVKDKNDFNTIMELYTWILTTFNFNRDYKLSVSTRRKLIRNPNKKYRDREDE